jgi:hypothetical protein
MDRSFCRFLLIVGVTLYAVSSASQTTTLASLSTSPELQRLTRQAGLIFTGTVAAITPIRGHDSDQISSVEVTFQVEQAVRGPRAGQRFSIREWPGLWVSGERYRVGQRMTIFLYPPSRVGLTSPVGGATGRFDVDRDGQILLKPVQRPIVSGTPLSTRSNPPTRVPLGTFNRAVRQMVEESR